MIVKVWVLIIFMRIGYAGGPVIVDNIASQEDCVFIQNNMKQVYTYEHSKCIQYDKVISK